MVAGSLQVCLTLRCQVAAIFNPGRLSVALSVDQSVPCCPWAAGALSFPSAYSAGGSACQAFACGGRTAFYSAALGSAPAAAAAVADKIAPGTGLQDAAGSPVGSQQELLLDDGSAGSGSPPPGAGAWNPAGALNSNLGVLPSRLAFELRRLARRSGACAGIVDEDMATSERGSDIEGLGLGFKTRPASPGAASSGAASDRSDADVVALGAQLVLDAGLGNPLPNPNFKTSSRRLRGALARSVADVLALYDAALLPSGDAAALDAHIARLVAAHGLEDPVYVVDLGMVVRLWAAWAAAMPRVAPFYAVKCNDDEALLATLAVMGAGFDCAYPTGCLWADLGHQYKTLPGWRTLLVTGLLAPS